MTVSLQMANPDNRVEYELWYSSIVDLEYFHIYDLKTFQQVFGDKTLFEPKIRWQPCDQCSADQKKLNCVGNGAICSFSTVDPQFMATGA
jgi:hypothetical protein